MKTFIFLLTICLVYPVMGQPDSVYVNTEGELEINGEPFFPFGWTGVQGDPDSTYTSFVTHDQAFQKIARYGVFNVISPDYYKLGGESELDDFLSRLDSGQYHFRIIMDTPRKEVAQKLYFTKNRNYDGLVQFDYGRCPEFGWAFQVIADSFVVFHGRAVGNPLPIQGGEYLSFIFGESPPASFLEYVELRLMTQSGETATIRYVNGTGTDTTNGLNLTVYLNQLSTVTAPVYKRGGTETVSWKIFHRNWVQDFISLTGTADSVQALLAIGFKGKAFWLSDGYVFRLKHYLRDVAEKQYLLNPARSSFPHLLGWHIGDEPDTYEYTFRLIWKGLEYQANDAERYPDIYPTYLQTDVIPAIYQTFKQDSFHPSFMTVFQKYAEYAAYCDVLMVDKYNVFEHPRTGEPMHFNARLVQTPRICRELTRGLLGNPPLLRKNQMLMVILQGHGKQSWNGKTVPQVGSTKIAPLETEYRYLIYSSMINGARGILFWTFYLSNDRILQRTARIGKELFENGLDRVLLQGIDRTALVTSNWDGYDQTARDSTRGKSWAGYGLNDINYILLQYPADSLSYYLLVSNDADKRSDVREIRFHFIGEQFRHADVRVLIHNHYDDEFRWTEIPNRFLKIENGMLSDVLLAWDVRVYQITPRE